MKRFLLTLSVISLLACGSTPVRGAEDLGLLIFNHQVAIGMTFANVQAAWGKPEKVDRSAYSGTVVEYWFFKNGSMVVFENGRVRSFHQ